MNILSVCSEPTVMNVLRLVVLFIKIIRVAVPIALIVTIMLKFTGAVTKHDDDLLNKAMKSIVPNAIAAVLIFLIPSFVDIVVRISFPNSDYSKCISGISIKTVNEAYNSKMDKLIDDAEASLAYTDYSAALAYLQYIKDSDKKEEYEEKLRVIKELIDVLNNQDGDGPSGGDNPAAGIVATCTGEYENIYGNATIKVKLSTGSATNYKFLIDGKTVQSGRNTTYIADSEYIFLIEPKVTIKSSNGLSTTIKCSTKHSDYFTYKDKGYYFSTKQSKDKTGTIDNPYPSNSMPYYMHIPKDISPNEKLPLIIGLHGGYGISTCSNGTKTFVTTEGTQTNHYFKIVYYYGKYKINSGKDDDLKAFIITLSNNRCSWNDNMYGAMDIIHAIIKTYNIDLDHVYLTGVSQGGAGTLYLGFLEEQILYKAKDNDTTLSSVAERYNTTVDAIKSYNKATGHNISYSDSGTKLKSGSVTIIRSRNDNEPGSFLALLMPFSPAHVLYRKGFVNENGVGTPPHVLKTPIWLVTSNDEYAKVQQMAQEVTTTYNSLGDVRYTVLTKLSDAHDTDTAFFSRTGAAKWLIGTTRGQVSVKNNREIDSLESQMGSNFSKVWRP